MKAALLQIAVKEGESAEHRFQRIQTVLSKLLSSETHIDLMVLPELWRVGFSHFDNYFKTTEPLQGSTTRTFARWAKRLNCTMVPGSFLEKQKDGTISNTMPLITPDGIRKTEYRKIHLFGYQSKEPQLLKAGDKTVVYDTPVGRMGLATCYDLRFPEQFRRMLDDGAEVFCVSAAWPRERMIDWRSFCRVRAMENQCFLFGCNNSGAHAGVAGAGHSMVVAPDGTIIAEAGEEEETLVAEFDPNDVKRIRESFPVLQDRVKFE